MAETCRRAALNLRARGIADGFFIVFDEFGKYLEGPGDARLGADLKLLQDMAELCCREADADILLSCVTHKAIGEYAADWGRARRNAFTTVEGRFAPIYFTATFEGSFSLIAGALGRDAAAYARYAGEHAAQIDATAAQCAALRCFDGYTHSAREIAAYCFPMHPLAALLTMKLSERAAQNERTLFTFITDADGALQRLIRENDGEYALLGTDAVYDYFHAALRESGDKDAREIMRYADALLTHLGGDEAQLVRAVALLTVLRDGALLPTAPLLRAALMWDDARLEDCAAALRRAHRLYVRKSDGVFVLTREAGAYATEMIAQEIERRRGRIDLAGAFRELRDPGYSLPRRYNDAHALTRFFRNVLITAASFLKQTGADFLTDAGFADGYVLYILGDISPEAVRERLAAWGDARVVALLPSRAIDCESAVETCAAIRALLARETDEVAREELSYYFDDESQIVNRAFTEMFENMPTLVTLSGAAPCRSVGRALSQLCEETLYPLTPVVNHEMINRSRLSGQMRLIRARAMDALLTQEDPFAAFKARSAEYAVLRATIGHREDDDMAAVRGALNDFLSACEDGAQPLGALYAKLTRSPIGLRRPLIPLYLAHALRGRIDGATLTRGGQEIAIDGEALSVLDEHAEAYALRIEKGSAERETYLQALSAALGVDTGVRALHEALSRAISALPRCARTNRALLLPDGTAQPLDAATMRLRAALLRYTPNAREMILSRLPEITGLPIGAACAADILKRIDALRAYGADSRRSLAAIATDALGGGECLEDAAGRWRARYADCLTRVMSRTAEDVAGALGGDRDILPALCVAVNALPCEDWNDELFAGFADALRAALAEIERGDDAADTGDSFIELSCGGRHMRAPIDGGALEGLAAVAYDAVSSALNEFAEALTPREKLGILSRMILEAKEQDRP